ncbi:MAG: transglutaminase domain-containing protein [Calditrichaeota bacterium]|nr:transglutaminase domain-containing protein [Calditrichota bacterium]
MNRFLRFIVNPMILLVIGMGSGAAFLLAGDPSADPAHAQRSFWFTYRVVVPELPEQSQRVDLWIPIPRSNAHQSIENIQISANLPYELHQDPKFGNRMAYFHARRDLPDSIRIELTFRVTRKTVQALKDGTANRELTPEERREYLSPDSLVPINDRIYEEVRKAAPEDLPPLEKARAFYDYLVETMRYDKSGEGWGRGDAIYACDVRRGNCTDFHSLFISMARVAGIPARFIIGFPVPHTPDAGEIGGYHCWAEFYVPRKGWIPVDASEAHKHPDRRDFLFGGLDPDRVAFTLGRDIPLAPPVTSRKLNYFIYPYVLVDGHVFENYRTQFLYRNVSTSEASISNGAGTRSSD